MTWQDWTLIYCAAALTALNVWQVIYWRFYNGWLTESLVQREQPNGAPSSMR